MSDNGVLPKKINQYLERLIIDYERNENALASILQQSGKIDVRIECEQEQGYREFHTYYKIIIPLTEECFKEHIPLKSQANFEEKIKEDLNRVITESNESVHEIRFEMKSAIDSNQYLKNKLAVDPEKIDLWEKGCLRVFISHSVKDYDFAKTLKDQFIDSDISCFVAHKDIKPTKKWRGEIRKALHSMEVMLVIITKDSGKSAWVNQEIGFALSQRIPIIPIKLDQNDPQAFISEIQAMTLDQEDDISNQAQSILKCITSQFFENPNIRGHFLKQFLKAKDGSFINAKNKFMYIINFKFNDQEIEQIIETIEGSAKYINQLSVILSDEIIDEHLKMIPNTKYKYYAELLEDKIFSQHIQKRYSLKKIKENGYISFDIIDDQKKNAENQKESNEQTFEDLPF